MAEETLTTTSVETPEAPVAETKAEQAVVAETKAEQAVVAETKAEQAVVAETESEQKSSTENGTSKSTENGSEEKSAEVPKEADPALKANVVKQIEYYFGDYNLPRDKFLNAEIKKDDGWIPLSTMMKFARLARLTSDINIVATALKESENSIMEVDETLTKIRRSLKYPLPLLEEDLRDEAVKRTIYCKGFPKDGSVTLDDLLEFFKPFGDYDSVKMRNYVNKDSEVEGFKGSVLVVFKTKELAEAFFSSPPVQYKKIYLIRKWYADYLEEKKQEIEERRAKKQARMDKNENGNKRDFEELPRGNFLKATGFSDDTSREDIKAAILDLTNDCAFVEFKKGDTLAYIRFREADSNKAMLATLKGNLKVRDAVLELSLVEGEEEEAQLQKANDARRRAHSAGPFQGKKRKMGGGRFNKHKRQRNN